MTLLQRPWAGHSVAPWDADVDHLGGAAPIGVGAPPTPREGLPRVVIVSGRAMDAVEELLLAAGSGDRGALVALERRMGRLVRVNIRRVLRDSSRSEAVTQEFFAEVRRDASTFDPTRDTAQGWLLTRAHRRAIDGLRPAAAARPPACEGLRMKLARHLPRRARSRLDVAHVAALVAVLSTGMLLPLGVAQAATAVPLGTAGSFAVLAGSTITNSGPSTVTGDVGVHPGTSVTGFDDVTHEGSLHVADGVALQAKADLDTAYTNAADQTPVSRIGTELAGATLTAGAYDSAAGTFGLSGTLTLNGEGDPDAVFIFQMGSTLTTAAASRVELINGASLCNVYWQVGSSATLGENSTFRGTIMADQSVSLGTGRSSKGGSSRARRRSPCCGTPSPTPHA